MNEFQLAESGKRRSPWWKRRLLWPAKDHWCWLMDDGESQQELQDGQRLIEIMFLPLIFAMATRSQLLPRQWHYWGSKVRGFKAVCQREPRVS
jgi:hypothetical protein